MSEKVLFAETDGAPSYEQTEKSPPYEETPSSRSSFPPESKPHPRHSLFPSNPLTATRSCLISTLLATTIQPLLTAQFSSGIHKRTTILLPSDVLVEQATCPSAGDVVGLPASATASLSSVIRLHGDENRAAFWQQEGVLLELECCLRTRLGEMGFDVEGERGPAEPEATEQRPWLKNENRPYQTLRLLPSTSDEVWTTSSRLGWRSPTEDNTTGRKLRANEVRASIEAKSVSFRVETAMGLWDSVNGIVLWLEVEVGH